MKLLNQLNTLAKESPEQEICGFITIEGKGLVVVPSANVADNPKKNYELDVREYAQHSANGNLIATYHSHPEGGLKASPNDKASSDELGLPSFIVGVPEEDVICYVPKTFPLRDLGNRPFCPLLFDCLTLCEDYYNKVKNIHVTPMERTFKTWNALNKKLRYYLDDNKFERVAKPTKEGDVIVMAFEKGIPCHAAIYMGDGIMAHQHVEQDSVYVPYGGYWERSTCMILRHESNF